jgi:DtxR family Mn-dependent transcriptional regulator
MTTAPLSQTAEDYLKEIYKLQTEQGRATTSALAERVGVSPPSATAMLKKLAELKLVRHEPYHGVTLTRAGEKAAIEIIRHHRLLEQYLSETLGLPVDHVHAEADRLEHALSEELEARIDESLGFPTHDPHGDPIPNPDGAIAAHHLESLLTCPLATPLKVTRIADQDPAFLRFIESYDLKPGQRVEVETRDAAADSVLLRNKDRRMTIGARAASKLLVEIDR